ncbi:hypothetical protein [Aquisphaera insulae]|uniref:hypothetical protein n=1 Tax=Aquisphaera insulae TaxID=2712864 RepID=UPI0013E9BF9B|nr:hypothetical protein [Aquisphaera insulae]
MTLPTVPGAPDELPLLDPGQGLQDPRTIHPAPDDVFNDPALPTGNGSSDGPNEPEQEPANPADAGGGIVDPRTEPKGPEL